jgi:hypothetical protein
MIDTTNITNRVLYDSLLSDTCPACGGPKVKRQTLCRREYFKLPKPMRNATYATIASGNYRPAVIEALNYLGAEKFHIPPLGPAV